MSGLCQIQATATAWARQPVDDFEMEVEIGTVAFSVAPHTGQWLRHRGIVLNIHTAATVICEDVTDGCHIIDRPDPRYVSLKDDFLTLTKDRFETLHS